MLLNRRFHRFLTKRFGILNFETNTKTLRVGINIGTEFNLSLLPQDSVGSSSVYPNFLSAEHI